jgi:hypothetical protein
MSAKRYFIAIAKWMRDQRPPIRYHMSAATMKKAKIAPVEGADGPVRGQVQI